MTRSFLNGKEILGGEKQARVPDAVEVERGVIRKKRGLESISIPQLTSLSVQVSSITHEIDE